MALTSIFELGVAEAHALLRDRFGLTELPPLDAIENEDWGRDYLLSHLGGLSAEALASAGLTLADTPFPHDESEDAISDRDTSG